MSIIADLAATLFRILIRKVEPPHYSTTQSAVHCGYSPVSIYSVSQN